MRIADDILNALGKCTIKTNTVYLPDEQLDRKTYLAVNKHIEHLGGKWNRKAKGHVFDSDPSDSFENMLVTGETTDFKKEFQFFETPNDLVLKMIAMAELKNTDYIMEPSAGKGAIVKEIKIGNVECNELNPVMAQELALQGIRVACTDFIKITLKTFDKIIMNPPFTKQQDVLHFMHAYSLLKKDGILVSVMSESPFFRDNNRSKVFREFLDRKSAEIIINPEGTFKASGTMVRTRLVKIVKRLAGQCT